MNELDELAVYGPTVDPLQPLPSLAGECYLGPGRRTCLPRHLTDLAEGRLIRFQTQAAVLHPQCSPRSTRDEPWCVAFIGRPTLHGQVVYFAAVAQDCCSEVGPHSRARVAAATDRTLLLEQSSSCEAWARPLHQVDAVPASTADSDTLTRLPGALAAASASCNVSLAQGSASVILYDDVSWEVTLRKRWFMWLLSIGSLLWAPLGVMLFHAAVVCGKGILSGRCYR